MGRFFLGSKSGDDARYRQKEQALAQKLSAPPEFATVQVDRTRIRRDWLEASIQQLFREHLHFDDDITANMIADSVLRGEDPRHILVSVTALSHEAKAAFNMMQALWRSLADAPYVSIVSNAPDVSTVSNAPYVSTVSNAHARAECFKDEISLLREKVVADLAKKKQSTSQGSTTRSSQYHNERGRGRHHHHPNHHRDRPRSRSPHRSPRIQYHQPQLPTKPESTAQVPLQGQEGPLASPSTANNAFGPTTNWERVLREKAWQAATLSSANKHK